MSRAQTTFWRRRNPPKALDIALLRPPTLKKGRFETLEDAHSESLRSGKVLAVAGDRLLSETLDDCRSGAYVCEKPFCPICARSFRRWFVAEMLGHLRTGDHGHVATVLLEAVKPGDLAQSTFDKHRALLRKRLRQSVSADVVVIGCFEVVYKARAKCWMLHINLLMIGSSKAERKLFKSKWAASVLPRPIKKLRVKDPAKQVSYVPKFTTYHRPGRQSGPKRPPPKPLNTKDHAELVRWMAQWHFEDFMFLHNCRRNGTEIA